MTFKQALWRAARVKLFGFVVVAALAVPWLADHSVLPSERPVTEPAKALGMPGILHDHLATCWTASQPAQVAVPGHAIVRTGTGPWRYVGEAGTTRALESVFGDGELVVLAFCR